MQLFSEETLMKLKALPAEKRMKVIDGLAKMLAARPKDYLRALRENLLPRKNLAGTLQIKVIYDDGVEGIALTSILDHLINMKEIVAFCRSDGWVRIDCDPIRNRTQPFEGPGKRFNDIFNYK
jgi:hypothetical protein